MHESEYSTDWKWQIANRIASREQLEKYVGLTPDERAAFDGDVPLSFAITPHYAGLIKHPALRATVIPTGHESQIGTGELVDPLGEEDHRVTPHLIHTYPDKVLFLATTFCSTYCRYCTRSRMVGKPLSADVATFEKTFQYIESHTEIRDVLLSGGDPLTMTDSVLD